MTLDNFINLELLRPVNIIIIVLIAALVPAGLALISSPHQQPVL
jgi:hypothetical protein